MKYLKRQFVIPAFALGLVAAATASAQESNWLVEEGALRLSVQEFTDMIRYNVPAHEQESWKHSRDKFNNLLSDYFMLKQLEHEAKAKGIDQEPEIASKLALQRLRSLSSVAMQRKLDALAEPDFEEAAREMYVVERSRFHTPDEVHARHILIAVNEQRDEEAALQRAQEVRDQLLADPEQIAELASLYSDDPSAQQNQGDLGFFAASRMVKPFADAAFALQPGEISAPVRSEFGYHVIQLVAKRAGKPQEFAEVKDQLIGQVRASYQTQKHGELRHEIQLRKSVDYNLPAVEALYEQLTADK